MPSRVLIPRRCPASPPQQFSPVIFPLSPCYAEIGPCYFFLGISPEILRESALDDDIASISDQILQFSPVFCPDETNDSAATAKLMRKRSQWVRRRSSGSATIYFAASAK